MQLDNIVEFLLGIVNLFSHRVFEIMAAAFFGGLFAGLFSNHFESLRRKYEKRAEKYEKHKNALVQIEHELVPARLNLDRTMLSIEDAIKHNSKLNTRLILRFYPVKFSTGLSLLLQDIDLINEYADLYQQLQRLNSDLNYTQGLVEMIKSQNKSGGIDPGLEYSYKSLLEYLLDFTHEIDNKSLLLLAKCQVILNKEDEQKIRDNFIQHDEKLAYKITASELSKRVENIKIEETPVDEGHSYKPKVFMQYVDLIKVINRVSF